jgi:hypothetical protein
MAQLGRWKSHRRQGDRMASCSTCMRAKITDHEAHAQARPCRHCLRDLLLACAVRHDQFLPACSRPSATAPQSDHASDGATPRQQHGDAAFDGSRWILDRTWASWRTSRKRGLGMRDGKLHDKHLGGIGGTQGEHAAVWHPQLWHCFGLERRTALLVFGPWSVEHMTLTQLAEAQKLAREWKPTKGPR